MNVEITAVESKRLSDLETVVENGLGEFLAVGKALMAIRDERLYRIEHDTFEAYVIARWGFGRVYAYRLISAAKDSEMLPMGNKPPTERAARALRKNRLKAQAEREEANPETLPDPERDNARELVEAAGVTSVSALTEFVRAVEIMREEELLLGKREWLLAVAQEHEESARALREKARDL